MGCWKQLPAPQWENLLQTLVWKLTRTASSPARWESSSVVPWELRPSLGARLGMRLHPSGPVAPALGCHPQPSSNTSSTPLLSWKTRHLHCCSDRRSSTAVKEGSFILKEALFLTVLALWHGSSQHSPPGLPAMWDSPAAVQKNSPLHTCDRDLKCCRQGPEGVEPGESDGVLRRGQPLRARTVSGVGFPRARKRWSSLCLCFEGGAQESPRCAGPLCTAVPQEL